MSNKDKMQKENCSLYQEKIVELFDHDISFKSDRSLNQHLHRCTECQYYLENLIAIKNRLDESPSLKLEPDRRIIKNILSYNKLKIRLNRKIPNQFWNSIWQLFEYRIPVYQALGGLVVIFMLSSFISSDFVTTGNKAISIEYSRDYEDLTSSELYLVDTLSLNKPERGQNVKEDSLLMSFLVPTM
jgi:hypothetical protein